MTEFSFYLSEDDTERLFAIKELQGLDDLTGNEFARRLLEGELYRQFPAAVKRDEQGSIINADRYRGDRQGGGRCHLELTKKLNSARQRA